MKRLVAALPGLLCYAPCLIVLAIALLSDAVLLFGGAMAEGCELLRARYLLEGARLYEEVYDDQPWLHTYCLAGLFWLFGLEPLAPRLLSLLCAGVLIGCVRSLAKSTGGEPHALFGVLCMMATPYWWKLPVSAMLELPAITLGVAALVLAVRFSREGRHVFWGGSALLMASAGLTKFAGLLAAPACAAMIACRY